MGHDHVFRKNKSGNFRLLQNFPSDWTFTVEPVQAIKIEDDFNIGSTKIRNLVLTEAIVGANKM